LQGPAPRKNTTDRKVIKRTFEVALLDRNIAFCEYSAGFAGRKRLISGRFRLRESFVPPYFFSLAGAQTRAAHGMERSRRVAGRLIGLRLRSASPE
jgi:hypothetical protein